MSTLIEKFKTESQSYCKKSNHKLNAPVDKWIWHGMARGLEKASEIVKQHSDWISVNERLPPDNMMVLAYCNIRKTVGYAFVSHQQAWSFYHFTKNSENQALAMVNDISKWMPIPQPPIEVQP